MITDRYKVSDEYDKKRRTLYYHICDLCGNEFLAPKHLKLKYCSPACGYASQKDRLNIVCDTCGNEFEIKPSRLKNSKSGKYFCTRECKDKAQRLEGLPELHLPHYGTGKSHYRQRALNTKANVCAICGIDHWNGIKITLDVHHIDGNRDNNKLDNLLVVCPNCHRTLEMQKWACGD